MPDLAFDAIVTHLRADDPAFVRRVHQLDARRTSLRTPLVVLLWTVSPLCIILGGWTGTMFALIAVTYGTHLIRTRERPGGTESAAPTRRPGASL